MRISYADRSEIVEDASGGVGYGNDAQTIEDRMHDAIIHYLTPATRQNLIKKFCTLTATWQQEELNTSSITNIAMNSAYQAIIGMGPIVLPLIFNEMQSSPDHWFWALKAITGEDPVNPEDRGNLEKMTKAWLDWSKTHGRI